MKKYENLKKKAKNVWKSPKKAKHTKKNVHRKKGKQRTEKSTNEKIIKLRKVYQKGETGGKIRLPKYYQPKRYFKNEEKETKTMKGSPAKKRKIF